MDVGIKSPVMAHAFMTIQQMNPSVSNVQNVGRRFNLERMMMTNQQLVRVNGHAVKTIQLASGPEQEPSVS
jgi:hypothetical protein